MGLQLAPILPFLALLFTRMRWVAVASAAGGYAVGFWLAGMLIPFSWPFAQRGWLWWVMLAYAAAVSAAMALAETIVAALLQRGRFFRGLLSSLAAHAAWLAVIFGLHTTHPMPKSVLLVQAAMIGAAAATLGARRRKAPPTSTSSG